MVQDAPVTTRCVPGRVSVIIPTYNRAQLLSEALESALSQTYADVEVIVVDDGSTDTTDRVLSEYANRVVCIRQQNAGPPAARNAGLRVCSGEFVVFLDSDDLLLPQKVELQVAYLRIRPSIDAVYGDGYTLNEDGVFGPLEPYVVRFPRENPLALVASLLSRNLFAINCALVRRCSLPAVGPFDESLTAMEDWDLWLRMVLGGGQIAYEDDKVAVYRRYGNNTDVLDPGRFQIASEDVIMKVVTRDLDSGLPLELRRQYRSRFLRLIARRGSVPVVFDALCVLLMPIDDRSIRAWMSLAVSLIKPGSGQQRIVGSAIVALLVAHIPSPMKRSLRSRLQSYRNEAMTQEG
jgi:glycosyltransferase involved in cell wall biosynthesis